MDLPCNFRMLSWACSLQTWSKTDAEFMAGKWLGRTSIRASSQTQKVTQQLTLWSLKDKNKSEWCLGPNGTLLIRGNKSCHWMHSTTQKCQIQFSHPILWSKWSYLLHILFPSQASLFKYEHPTFLCNYNIPIKRLKRILSLHFLPISPTGSISLVGCFIK